MSVTVQSDTSAALLARVSRTLIATLGHAPPSSGASGVTSTLEPDKVGLNDAVVKVQAPVPATLKMEAATPPA